MVEFIDTHAHLFASEFDTDISEVLNLCDINKVKTVLLPNIDETTVDKMVNLCKTSTKINCIPMLGLHPCHVTKNYKEQLDAIFKTYEPSKFAAVGEMGLDLYWDQNTYPLQKKAFELQIEKAIEWNLPVALHTRNATAETIGLLKPFKGKVTGVFHCFGDTEKIAHEIIDLGFYLGIGGVLTFKNSGLENVIKNISLDNLILETDAPYLAPVPFRGKKNQSAYLVHIAQKLAEVKQVTIEQIAEATTLNAKKLFKLDMLSKF